MSITINPIQIYPKNTVNNYYSVSFGSKYDPLKQIKFEPKDFFVNIEEYGQNLEWAEIIIKTADEASEFIRKECDFEQTLINITKGVMQANRLLGDIYKQMNTGYLRTVRPGWSYHPDCNVKRELITVFNDDPKNKFKDYANRLASTIRNPIRRPKKLKGIGLTRSYFGYLVSDGSKRYITSVDHFKQGKPRYIELTDYTAYSNRQYIKPTGYIKHADPNYINAAFEYAKSTYNDIYNKYIIREAKQRDLNDINSAIAEIRWILAHATPWERGSDAISNTFIRSLYKAIGIKTYPLKKGVSLDIEAYCTNLDDYKNHFAKYFELKPEIIR